MVFVGVCVAVAVASPTVSVVVAVIAVATLCVVSPTSGMYQIQQRTWGKSKGTHMSSSLSRRWIERTIRNWNLLSSSSSRICTSH